MQTDKLDLCRFQISLQIQFSLSLNLTYVLVFKHNSGGFILYLQSLISVTANTDCDEKRDDKLGINKLSISSATLQTKLCQLLLLTILYSRIFDKLTNQTIMTKHGLKINYNQDYNIEFIGYLSIYQCKISFSSIKTFKTFFFLLFKNILSAVSLHSKEFKDKGHNSLPRVPVYWLYTLNDTSCLDK